MTREVDTMCGECGAQPVTVTFDDPANDYAGAFEMTCEACSASFYVPAEAKARSRIGKVREVARTGMAARVEGYLMDIQTANLLVTVFAALSPKSRERFGQPSLPRLVDFCWKAVR